VKERLLRKTLEVIADRYLLENLGLLEEKKVRLFLESLREPYKSLYLDLYRRYIK